MQSEDGTAAGTEQENVALYPFPPPQANGGKWPGSPHSKRAERDPAAVQVGFIHTRDMEKLFHVT